MIETYNWNYQDNGQATATFTSLDGALSFFRGRKSDNRADYAFIVNAKTDQRFEAYMDNSGNAKLEKL